ncbi:MAG: alpha-2-macroglobulin, partial [Lentisphaerae bacterium]|nr:alpha-2-macroglobulin [Lentisphaerota bacterium]
INEYPDNGKRDYFKEGAKARLDQIVGNWGRFEPVMSQPAGKEPTVEFRFRNGKKVSFEAHAIKVKDLLDDVMAQYKLTPNGYGDDRINIADIGYRLVVNGESKYIDGKAASWAMDLEPRPNHFDKRITVKAPLKKAGAYLLTAKMENGNNNQIVLWLNDTAIVRKPMAKGCLYFVADAVTGRPVAGADVAFFGYHQEGMEVRTKNLQHKTDKNGLVVLKAKELSTNYNWLAIATTDEGRMAYIGFSEAWLPKQYGDPPSEFFLTLTDRPVYRPGQTVKFKCWLRRAEYDMRDNSEFAGRVLPVEIHNPKDETIFEGQFKADAYGGLSGEFVLPKDAALGQYSLVNPEYWWSDAGKFRVEEYKKPEFEVKIEAPTEPVMLGEKITATLSAAYYFGAPVAKGRVKYKVTRTEVGANWHPVGAWDWLYGNGYGWYAYNYRWYPGWTSWGCPRLRPRSDWWTDSGPPPEIVAEGDTELPPDGILKVEIATAPAKELFGDRDHEYKIAAEITDESRRAVFSTGRVLMARKPFQVYVWVDRGHYRVGDTVRVEGSARRLDGKPVTGKGELTLFKIAYDKDNKPSEKAVQTWPLDAAENGPAAVQIKASEPGQYRLSYKVTDAQKHTIEGGYVFCVMGQGTDAANFRFNDIELVTDKGEYAPGETVRLMINTARSNSTVVLFLRPVERFYTKPQILRLTGKSTVVDVDVTKKDMPNFFVEAFTIGDGKVFSDMREIVVPPEKRVLNVKVKPSSESFKPREKAKVRVRLTDLAGKPFVGSVAMTVYDKALEYISGGSNVPEIREFFWKRWRTHNLHDENSLKRWFESVVPRDIPEMRSLGFSGSVYSGYAESWDRSEGWDGIESGYLCYDALSGESEERRGMGGTTTRMMKERDWDEGREPSAAQAAPLIRSAFADTAFWAPTLTTDANGEAEVEFTTPDNLTGWKIMTWAMGHGTKVGQGTAQIVTSKNLLLRLQAPRFFIEKDEVVLSANIHNYLKSEKAVEARLELEGGALEPMQAAAQKLSLPAGGEQRVDWRVKVVKAGEATVRMKALTDEESDAMEMKFPSYVHGVLKTESYSRAIRPEGDSTVIEITVPKERKPEQSRLEIRYSPTLALAMVDASYLADYPYGCTEQTLNRFVPAVLTRKVLKDLGLDLEDIRKKITNLNAQEIGDDPERTKGWKRLERNPVFDEALLNDMVREGIRRLAAMQMTDGGWGWFSGWGERSDPHITACVVHGLLTAQTNGVAVSTNSPQAVPPQMMEDGIRWLKAYEARQVDEIRNAPEKLYPYRGKANDLDAFVRNVMSEAGEKNAAMSEFLFRDKNDLSVYGKVLLGLTLLRAPEDGERLAVVMKNIEQYLVLDDENQSAWLKLPASGRWWFWYGDDIETQAGYLRLLAKTEPKSEKTSRLAKYVLNNRKHGTYWKSTRDTAFCLEAMADYLRASGEDQPDMTVEILLDGQKLKEVVINAENLFTFDNQIVLTGVGVQEGKHRIEFRKKGRGPLYVNAYLTNFTLEDFITAAGLEIKVNRKFYRLIETDKKEKAEGSRGQAVDVKAEKYTRQAIPSLDVVKSGDLVEVELAIESKNDYEYIVIEDRKAAGFEPVDIRSGYNGNDMGAYVEFRDERVAFFVRTLVRGMHSMAYRLRAEIPGKFSALPAHASAMYAPELQANSDEFKVGVADK